MKPKRLLIVSEPGTYGVFFYVRNLIHYLWTHCPETAVDFAFSTQRGSPELLALVKEVQQHGGETLDLRVGNAPASNDLRALTRLWRLIRQTRPNLIHANSSKAGGLCRLLRLLPSCPPVLYSAHAYYGMRGRRDGGKAILMYNGIEMALGRLGCSLTYCADERDFARHALKIPGRKIVLIHHGIDRAVFCPASREEKLKLRAEFGIPADRPLLIALGRESYQKNYRPLYVALDKLLGRPDAKFVFSHAGQGATQLAASLSAAARRHVYSFEFRPDVHRLLKAADAFVMTSRYETLGLAALEAMACGLKIFLTRTMGLRCYASLGFDEIIWLDPADEAGGLTDNLARAFDGWFASLDAGRIPLIRQVELVRHWFDRDTQFGKTCRLYSHLAR